MDKIKSLTENVRHSLGRIAKPEDQHHLDFSPKANPSRASPSAAMLASDVRPTSTLIKTASSARVSTGAGAIVGEVEWVADPSGKGMVPKVKPAEEQVEEEHSEKALHAKKVIEEAISKELAKSADHSPSG